MNVLVVNDLTWDNFAICCKRLTTRNIDPTHRINYFYSKHTQYISNICSLNMLTLIRRVLDKENIEKCLEETLRYTKFCIIFHNHLEYNTLSKIIIDLCEINKIPYFIFSEHTDKFIFNGVYTEDKFKNCVNSITFHDKVPVVNTISSINFDNNSKTPKDISSILNKIRTTYHNIEESKKKKSIIELDKEDKRQQQQYSYLTFMADKRKWLKKIVPKV